MIRRIVDFALENRLLVLGLAVVLFIWGIVSFKNLPIEAYPDVADNYVEGAVLRLRPIMMTMLVATLGLAPAALSHAIGSDSQRPFAIVIVGGLIADLVMSIFLLPTLYVWSPASATFCPPPNPASPKENTSTDLVRTLRT